MPVQFPERQWVAVGAMLAAASTLYLPGARAQVTCAPTAAPTCPDTHSCGFRCIGTDSYSKYTKAESVESNKPDAPFPSSGGEAEEYAEDAATPAAVVLGLGLILCLLCCCYNFCNCRRIDNKPKMIGCHPGECWVGDGCRKVGWVLLAVAAILYFALLSSGLDANKETADGIRGLPDFLNDTANYLEDPIMTALNCSAKYPNAVATTALSMQSSSAMTDCVSNGNSASLCDDINASLVTIIESSYDIQDQINGTKSNSAFDQYTGQSQGQDGIIATLSEGVRSLHDAAKEANDLATTAGDSFELGTNVLLAVLLVLGIFTFCLSALAGAKESWKGHYCLTSGCLNLLMLLFLLLAILCAAYLLVLRLSAGFCDDPFNIMVDSLKQANNTAGPYYTVCHTYTDTQLNTTWAWREPQDSVAIAFNVIDSLMTDLSANWTAINGEAPLLVSIQANVSALGCAFSGDTGVLGYSGLLKCSTFNRFVHSMVSGYCVDVFDPLYTLTVCLLVVAIVVIFANWVEVALRREVPNYKVVKPGKPDKAEIELSRIA
mmetsp:Transcript_25329/g.76290  ORF Transcript_25329/g.76290 Transcript_25329/m.76290 type:complete len:548 (+) Transcript_25329:58-1701(+)